VEYDDNTNRSDIGALRSDDKHAEATTHDSDADEGNNVTARKTTTDDFRPSEGK